MQVSVSKNEQKTNKLRQFNVITYLHVVLPTPPFPPTNIHLKETWSRRFLIVGSSGSNSFKSTASAILYIKISERRTTRKNWNVEDKPGL